MAEPQPARVEKLAGETVAAGAAIGRVAAYRVSDCLEVNPDLMGATGLEAHLGEGVLLKQLGHLEVGPCLARRAAAERDPFGRAVITTKRGIDRSRPRFEAALNQRGVVALDLPGANLLGEVAVGLRGPGDDEQAGGIPIKAMHDPRPRSVLAAAELIPQLVHQCWVMDSRGRMNNKARGLLNHEKPIVTMDDQRLRGVGQGVSPIEPPTSSAR